MKKSIIAGTCAFLLSACATPGSGIIKIGPDTYMHSSFGTFFTFSGSETKAKLYGEGNEFCEKQGKEFQPINSTAHDSGMGTYASAEIQFKCILR